MRVRNRLALLGLAVVLSAALTSAADEPAPLLKPVVPPGNGLRVRIPATFGTAKVMSLSAQVPNGKKKGELIDVTVAYSSLPEPSSVSAKRLEEWGYTVPKGLREFVLPELLIPASQIAPKPKEKDQKIKEKDKGSDVVVRLTNVKLAVVHDAASANGSIFFCDMCLSVNSLFLDRERTMEPRLSFGDKFMELTVPPTVVKRLGTDNLVPPEVTVSGDTKLVPVVGATTMRNGIPAFASASINGLDSYKLANGSSVPVRVAVSSIGNGIEGVTVTIGLARGVKIEVDQADTGMLAIGAEAKTVFIPGKIKELRLGVLTGPGLKTPKEFVLTDLPVLVDRSQSDGYLLLSQKFLDAHFADAVYANGGDGWKLHGRVDPELLFDPKPKIDPKKVDPKAKIDPKQKIEPAPKGGPKGDPKAKIDPKAKVDPKPKP